MLFAHWSDYFTRTSASAGQLLSTRSAACALAFQVWCDKNLSDGAVVRGAGKTSAAIRPSALATPFPAPCPAVGRHKVGIKMSSAMPPTSLLPLVLLPIRLWA
jgi:hypothetical protein